MANYKETGFNITIGAVADEASAEKATKDITKKVLSALKDGCIEIPATISEEFDKSKASDKLIKAQKDFINQWKKMSSEGFSSSEDDLKSFVDKFTEFKRLMGKEGKRNSKQNLAMKNTGVGEIVQVYKNATKQVQTELSKITAKQSSGGKQKFSQSAIDKALAKSREEYEKRRMKGKETPGPNRLGSTPPSSRTTSSIDPERTNEHLIRLSEYSAHGSNWANELAKILKEEIAKSAGTLIKFIEPNYKKLKNEVGHGNEHSETTEQQFLTDTIKSARKQLSDAIKELEAGSEDILLDDLKEYAAIIKVLNKALGKTTEKAEKDITTAIEGRYSQKANTRLGGTSLEGNQEKGVGPGHEYTQSLVSQLYKSMKQWDAEVFADRIAKEMLTGTKQIEKTVAKNLKKGSQANKTIDEIKSSDQLKNALKELNTVSNITKQAIDKNTAETGKAINDDKKTTEKQLRYDITEHSAERVADSAAGKKTGELVSKTDENMRTGLDTDAKSDELISAVKGQNVKPNPALVELGNSLQDMMCPCKEVLEAILSEIKSITKNGVAVKGKTSTDKIGGKETGLVPVITNALVPIQENIKKALVPIEGTLKTYYEGKDIIVAQKMQRLLEADSKRPGGNKPSDSTITTTRKDPHSIFTKIIDAFEQLTNTTANYRVIMAKTSEEQDKMNAERVKLYGLTNGTDPTQSSDKIKIARSLALWRGKDKFKDLFKDVNLSEGVKVDTTAITDKLAKVLSGKEMFKAQTGGWKNNLSAIMTGGLAYMWQPSLEKSRAQAEGVNQILADIRASANNTLQDIQDKESKLRGLEALGDLKRKSDGSVDMDTSTAEVKTLVVQLEESKKVLASILADVGMVDQVIGKTGGKISKIIQQLGFTSPILRKDNTILANLNAGLDKNGKALKFQTRMAEILNYAFQLMGRHVGQVFKNLMSLLNPINLLKRAFTDFMSYDVKWQRTMNVIKYNLRRIIRPFMEWIAQQLVNIIGLVNAVIKGIGQAFGQDWDLFDREAAAAEQMREELEAAANVTASFDELHDIGGESSSNAAMDLLNGDIYTPQWTDLYDTITKKAKELAETLKPLFKGIGDAINWCLENWDKLALALGAFIIGKALLDLLGLFTKLGTILPLLAGILGGALLFSAGVGLAELADKWDQMTEEERWQKAGEEIGKSIAGGAVMGAAIGFGIGGPLGALAGAGIGAALGGITASFVALTTAAYNGSEAATVAAGALGAAGLGGAIGFLVGGPLGAAIGAIGGGLVGALAGAAVNAVRCKGEFNKLKISTEDLQWATEKVTTLTDGYNISLENLTKAEKLSGESGERLYELVQKGARSYDDLSDTQKDVYNMYVNTKTALTELHKAQETELTYSARMALDNAKNANSFEEYIEKVQKGAEDGIISQKDMTDQFSQAYAELDENQRKIFLQQLPENMRDSVKEQSKAYISEWEKFKMSLSDFFNDLGQHLGKALTAGLGFVLAGIPGLILGLDFGDLIEGQKNELAELKATADDLKASTEALNKAQDEQSKIEGELAALERRTGIDAKQLYTEINNGTKSWYELTDAEKEVYNKYYELQEAMRTTDDAMKKNIDNMASIDLQAGQTSGDYSKFIYDLIDANQRGEISTEEMQKKFSQAYAAMDKDSRETFLQKIPESMREGVKQGSVDFMQGFDGFMGRLKKKLDEIGGWFSGVGEKVGGFFESLINSVTGKGFKTNKQLANEKANKKSQWVEDLYNKYSKIKSYDVGTNYVPNDGLAYLHQGEAVIPKKYNTPYSQDSSKLEDALYTLTRQVEQISTQVNQGINVKGQFIQKGTDLVATVQKANNKLSNNILNNKVYAR